MKRDGKLILICPLQRELDFLLKGFAKHGVDFKFGTTRRLPFFENKSHSLVAAIGGHGKTQFAIHTLHLLDHFEDASAVFCVGAAGGLAEHIQMCDLVVAEKTIEHDYTEKFHRATPPEFMGHSDWVTRAKAAKGSGSFAVFHGAVASGDEDIVDSVRATELFKSTGALAVAWEGSGGARACAFHQVPFLEVRAITDNARDSVADAFKKNLERCMYNAAEFILSIC